MTDAEPVPPLTQPRAVAEALVDVLMERGLVVVATTGPATRVLDVSAVARLLGRGRGWVYEHADELGAFRFGTGPKARLGFDVAAIERWKRQREVGPSGALQPTAHRRRTRQQPPTRGARLIPYEPMGTGRSMARQAPTREDARQ